MSSCSSLNLKNIGFYLSSWWEYGKKTFLYLKINKEYQKTFAYMQRFFRSPSGLDRNLMLIFLSIEPYVSISLQIRLQLNANR